MEKRIYDNITKVLVLSLLVSMGLLISNCSAIKHKYSLDSEISNRNQVNWVETVGTITESVQMNDGTYAYTIEFIVLGGNAKNIEGKLIQGPLIQHIFGVEKKAIEGQILKLRYSKDEPMFYELLEDIKFVK
jgi:hypothetical protein